MPTGEHEAVAVAHYSPWFQPRHRVISIATRRQGLMVAAGNPKKIYEVKDLLRPDVRFINRQLGSGTRYLLDLLLRTEGLDSSTIRGYEQSEFTHAAVAAYVASGMADAGFGVEVPARQFKLEFIPIQFERYFLLCDENTLNAPDVQSLIALLGNAAFKTAVDQLAGYRADNSARITTLAETFASYHSTAAARAPVTASR